MKTKKSNFFQKSCVFGFKNRVRLIHAFDLYTSIYGNCISYYRFDQQSRGIWCLADVSSVSPSSEQTEELWGNQCLNSW